MIRLLSLDEVNKLPDRTAIRVYWWAALLDDFPGSDVNRLLLATAHSSQALERGSALALASSVTRFLCERHAHEALQVTYFSRLHHVRDMKVGIPDAQSFAMTLANTIRQLACRNQIHLVRHLARDAHWAREFLAFAAAIAIGLACMPPTMTTESPFVAEYPFLAGLEYSHPVSRIFGKARHMRISAHAYALLCQPKYREVLNRVIDDVILDAPDGRAVHWATAAASVVVSTHPVDVAEALGFESGVSGMHRAKVLISRIGRRVHDRYFDLLCHMGMMTPALAEFMAIEFRMPVDVVRMGLAVAHITNSHAAAYSIPKSSNRTRN